MNARAALFAIALAGAGGCLIPPPADDTLTSGDASANVDGGESTDGNEGGDLVTVDLRAPPPDLWQLINGFYSSMALGDFDGDHRIDAIAISGAYSNSPPSPTSLTFFRGDGHGGFTAISRVDLGDVAPYRAKVVRAADLDGDGKLDAVVNDVAHAGVDVLRGNGDGTFAAPAHFSTGGSSTNDLLLVDLDGDKKLDVAVADKAGARVATLLGDGKGGFVTPARAAASGLALTPEHLASGDFDGDKKLDLVGGVYGSFDRAGLLVGAGDGSFTMRSMGGQLGKGPVAAGDFDEDGKLDMLTASSTDANILFGNGDGTFAFRGDASGFFNPTTVDWMVVRDVDGDGHLDVLTNFESGALAVRFGDGKGQFPKMKFLAPPMGATFGDGAIVDVDGDGELDVVALDTMGRVGVVLGPIAP